MVTIINTVKKKNDDVGLISVRWRDEEGNRQEDIFRHFPYVYVNPDDVRQLQSSREQVKGTERREYPIEKKQFMRRLKEWKRKKDSYAPAKWEHNVKMDGVVSHDDDDEQYNLDGTRLRRVDFRRASARNAFRRAYTPLYGSRTQHPEQFCIRPPMEQDQFESLFSLDAPTHIAYIDLETLQFAPNTDDYPKYTNTNHPRHSLPIGPNQAGLQEISMIAIYADWLDQYIVWAQHPNFEEYDTGDLPREYKERGEVRYFNDERDLLVNFVEWVETFDPDMFVAWNGDGYDYPMLHYRLDVTGVGPERMSPIVHSSNNQFTSTRDFMPPADNWSEEGEKILKGHYRASRQPIRGRATIDLMPAFAKWWRSTKGQDIGFRVSLNRATNELLKDYIDVGKDADFKWGFFDKAYDKFIEDYIYYNIRDVEAMVQVEGYANVIQLHHAMQVFLKVPFGSTFNATRFCGVMFSRGAGFLPGDPVWDNQPFAKYMGELMDDLSYEGAEVVDVEAEGNMGLHHNTGAFDAMAMYPRNIIGKNICWLTAYEAIEGDENAVTYDIHKEKDIIGYETVAFHPSTVMEGSLPKMVKVVLDERAYYKGEMKKAREAGDDLAYKQADNMQKAVKVVANSFYGVLGNAWEWGRDSVPHATWALAGATTKYGKKQIHTVREYCESKGFKTIFGHTDSVFVKLGDDKTVEECVEQGHELTEEINEFVQTALNHSGAEWEFEQFMDEFFIAKKNRYAGRIAWADGEFITGKDLKQRLKVSGFELKRANASKGVGDVQLEVFDLMFNRSSMQDIVTHLHNRYESVMNGDIPIEQLVARKTMRKHLPHAYRRVGYGQWAPCGCGSCPVMKTPGMTKEEKDGLDKRRDDDLCYAIRGPKASNYRRYIHGEQVWRTMDPDFGAAAWYNAYMANDTEPSISKGESFYLVACKDGPYPMPYREHKTLRRNYGLVGLKRVEQLSRFTPDYEYYAHETVVQSVKNVFEGMGWSLELISGGKVPTITDFLY